MMSKHSSQGFTLMEVMVVVVMLGVLISIAIPNYLRYVEKGDLEGARAELMRLNQTLMLQKIADPNFLVSSADEQAGKTALAALPKEQMVTRKYNLKFSYPAQRSLYILSAFPYVENRKQVVFINSKGEAMKCKTAAAANAFINSNASLGSTTQNCEPF